MPAFNDDGSQNDSVERIPEADKWKSAVAQTRCFSRSRVGNTKSERPISRKKRQTLTSVALSYALASRTDTSVTTARWPSYCPPRRG